MTNNVAQVVIKRDRNVVLAGLAAVAAAAAIHTINMARTFAEPVPMLHADHNGQSFLGIFVMWTVMQVAMMSPTAVPMLLMYTKIARHRKEDISPTSSTVLVFLGYVMVWALFSLLFAAIQMGLQSTALLSPGLASGNRWLSGSILIAAGLFQFSHLKQACLSQCRSPVSYFMTEWRNGRRGAFLMGLNHGIHCVGCCWILMALLFVAGVMNLFWMAIITAFVLIEKLAPPGVLFGRIAGGVLIVWGILILI
jgi:predicted metal-binding membrane protein